MVVDETMAPLDDKLVGHPPRVRQAGDLLRLAARDRRRRLQRQPAPRSRRHRRRLGPDRRRDHLPGPDNQLIHPEKQPGGLHHRRQHLVPRTTAGM